MNLMNMNAINENIERMEQDNIMFDVVRCRAGLISVPIRKPPRMVMNSWLSLVAYMKS